MDILRIAVEKAAGLRTREAWRWLVERVAEYPGARDDEQETPIAPISVIAYFGSSRS